jgi:hypothetical protein
MTKRFTLTEAHEAQLREDAANWTGSAGNDRRDLLAELDATRAALAESDARSERLHGFAEALISQAFQGRLMKEPVYRAELERANRARSKT